MQTKRIVIGIGVVILAALFFSIYTLLKPPQSQAEIEVFIVGMQDEKDVVINKLKEQGFIGNSWVFNLVLTIKGKHKIEPGGYHISKSMNVLQTVEIITSPPSLKWIVIPEGLRKEQIGEKFAETFGWSDEEVDKWNNVYTRMNIDYVEGVYFPDTYLIPVDEPPPEVAKRMQRRFNEKFAPYFDKFMEKNIKWTTALKIASLIQREAAGKEDMALIAGIIWNRLFADMKLDIDATVQYAKGKTEQGWWSKVTPEDIKNIDSPYNTYKYKGLPPHPIANPGLDAIEAVLNPEETECFFYLHDSNKQIYCAKTYEEHQENIEKYLK